MSRLKSVDITQMQSPALPKLTNERMINEEELNSAIQKFKIEDSNEDIDNSRLQEKKMKMGEYLFDNLNNYFDNKQEFINPTSAVYFQKVLYALFNKKGYEVFFIIIFHLNPFRRLACCLRKRRLSAIVSNIFTSGHLQKY